MVEFKSLRTLLDGELCLLSNRLFDDVLDFAEFLFELEEIAEVDKSINKS